MKPEEINVTIAEACGWRRVSAYGQSVVWAGRWIKGNPNPVETSTDIPNYYKDLNAIHEAESTLLPDCFHHATAPQRCEAFLKTVGKWVETKGEGE